MELEDFIPELLNLAQGTGHDDSDCPGDDTCRCENIFKLNAELKNIEKMLKKDIEIGDLKYDN